eukprot:g6873.t1
MSEVIKQCLRLIFITDVRDRDFYPEYPLTEHESNPKEAEAAKRTHQAKLAELLEASALNSTLSLDPSEWVAWDGKTWAPGNLGQVLQARLDTAEGQAAFHDSLCFDGEGLVLMADGSLKAVRHVMRGDRLRSGVHVCGTLAAVGSPGPVVAVRRAHCTVTRQHAMAELRAAPGALPLYLTRHHPVLWPAGDGNGKGNRVWMFPREVAPVRPMRLAHGLFNFELELDPAELEPDGSSWGRPMDAQLWRRGDAALTVVIHDLTVATLGTDTGERLRALCPAVVQTQKYGVDSSWGNSS